MKNNKSFVSLFSRNFTTLSAAAHSDVGSVRENNEDNYLLGSYRNTESADHSEAHIAPRRMGDCFIAAVFDGMGGGEEGERASATAAESLLAHVDNPGACGRTEADERVRAGLGEANSKIVEMQENRRICGSTGTVLCLRGREFKVYHLGDSRAYLRRDGTLFQLTRDQTLAQMKMEMGIYDYDDPRSEAEKHQLTDFLGRDKSGGALSAEESEWLALQKGDEFLLCSDGIYDACDDACLSHSLAAACGAREKAEALVAEAMARGSDDNVTAIIVQVN